MHAAAVGCNDALVALDHRRDLFTLVRMDQEHDLIVPHDSSLRIKSHPSRGAAWCGKETGEGPLGPDAGPAGGPAGGAQSTETAGQAQMVARRTSLAAASAAGRP